MNSFDVVDFELDSSWEICANDLARPLRDFLVDNPKKIDRLKGIDIGSVVLAGIDGSEIIQRVGDTEEITHGDRFHTFAVPLENLLKGNIVRTDDPFFYADSACSDDPLIMTYDSGKLTQPYENTEASEEYRTRYEYENLGNIPMDEEYGVPEGNLDIATLVAVKIIYP